MKKLKQKLEKCREEAVELQKKMRETKKNDIAMAINLGKIETLTEILTEIIPEIEKQEEKQSENNIL